MTVHLDTDFFIYAVSMRGWERARLLQVAESDQAIEMSAVAWYEFCRGPRLPEQIALARSFLAPHGIIAFEEEIAAASAEVFRQLGSPRRRAADIAIGVTARTRGATLLSRNARDFAGISGLDVQDETFEL